MATVAESYEQNLTKRQILELIRKDMQDERTTYEPHWKELQEYILPRRARFTVSDRNKGDRRNRKIINNTATLASRTLRAGMMTGLTSPARPWFKLTTPDPDLAEQHQVREWLDLTERRMRDVMLRSNFYNALPNVYGDNGTFASAAMIVLEDDRDVIRCYTFPVGSYSFGNDNRMKVGVFERTFELPARHIVTKFAKPIGKTGNKYNFDNISQAVQNAWETKKFEEGFEVAHIIMPNELYDDGKIAPKYKAFKSCYYETGSSQTAARGDINDYYDKFLKESGFDDFPVMGVRWELTGEDSYGTTCPGMECLGDVIALQTLEKRKAQAIEKQVNPPMTAPTTLKQKKASIIAGDITYYDMRDQRGTKFEPAHETRIDLGGITEEINHHERRISRAYYEDLFLMLAMSDRREITAREIEERHEEKLLMLGPVLERQNDELLDPVIDRIFNIMARKGLIPQAPPDLEGENLKVEYISIMAQAQKQVGTAGMERLVSFTGRLAEIRPSVADKLDVDQAVDEYADMLGVSPKVVHSDDEVKKVRDQREAKQAALEKVEVAAQGAEIASKLSKAGETPPGGVGNQ